MSVTPNIISGDVIIKSNVNNLRYGNGKLSLESGVLATKEVTTASVTNAVATYDNVFVDSTSKKLRIKNSTGITRDVGINFANFPFNNNITNINFTVLGANFLLKGSNFNGVPTNIIAIVNVTGAAIASKTVTIQLASVNPTASIICTSAATPIPTAGLYNINCGIISNYSSTDFTARVSGLRSAAGGTNTLVGLTIIY